MFKTQLRAIARASGYGPLRVLVPMVTQRSEILSVARMLKREVVKLKREGHAVAKHIPLGAMIEVPAAALALHTLIDKVDFLSIGTNDLIQYLLAADRANDALGDLYTPLHPAMLQLLHDVISTAERHGKPISVCGEMAADSMFTPVLLALGLKELSLHPGTMLEVRRAIRAQDLGHLRKSAPALLRARDRAAIERWLAHATDDDRQQH